MISYVRAGLLVVAIAITLGFLYPSLEQTLVAQNPGEMPAKQFDMLRNQYQDSGPTQLTIHSIPSHFVEWSK